MSHGGPPLFRCVCCGCPATDHAVDDEERRECTLCECTQYECDTRAAPPATHPGAVRPCEACGGAGYVAGDATGAPR